MKITNYKSDRLKWYENIGEHLKTQHTKFWKCVSSFTKHNSYIIHLAVNSTDVLDHLNSELNPIRHLLALVGARHVVHVSRIRVKPAEAAEVLAERFLAVHNTPVSCHSGLFSSDSFAVAPHFRIRHFESYKKP